MSYDPTPPRKRYQTETITWLMEQSRAVLMDAEALGAQSKVMLDELHRLRGGADLPDPGRRADGAGTRAVRPSVSKECP